MVWLCNCGKAVTTLRLLWQWRDAGAIGQKHGRNVCYGCRIGCEDCLHVEPGGGEGYQYVKVKLTAPAKSALVNQILAEVINQGIPGYLPKTDLQKALRDVHKGKG